MLDTIKSKCTDFYLKHGMKINGSLMAVSASVATMTIPASAEGASLDVSSTADTVISLMGKGLDFCLAQPVLSITFVAGLMGTVIFGNIKKAKRAVK